MRVGFIGLGTMGSPMAQNIRKAGHELVVYNRTESKTEPFRRVGVPPARTPPSWPGKATW